MTVLSAAICSNSGKPLLARQFKELNKDSITLYLTNFSTLLAENASQHTTIDSGLIRYLYQPVESFIVLIITNLNSNIIQDIDTLKLFTTTISSLLRSSSYISSGAIDPNDIFLNSFEILDAFDEIVTEGYKEDLTAQQIKTYLEMDSHEERLQEIIDKNKEREAVEQRKLKAIELARKEVEKRFLEAGLQSSSPFQQQQQYSSVPQDDYRNRYTDHGMLLVSSNNNNNNNNNTAQRSNNNHALESSNNKQFKLQNKSQQGTSNQIHRKPTIPEIVNEGILIVVNEKITAELSRDGTVKSSELKGDLQLRIINPDYAHCKLSLQPLPKTNGLQYKTHPNIDKAQFNSNILALKDSSKAFPSNDSALGVLRWRGATKKDTDDNKFLPVVFTVWTTQSGDTTNVTVEYELLEKFIDNEVVLKDINITVPDLSGVASTAVLQDDNDGNIEFNALGEDTLQFTIKEITAENASGSIDFSIEVNEEDYLFPMYVTFVSQSQGDSFNFSDVKVTEVVSTAVLESENTEDNKLPYNIVCNIISDNFNIV